MKIVAINGSPRGRDGNSAVMADALLAGAVDGGARTESVFLAEKDIRYCRGCFSCWTRNPGWCVTQDDMAAVLAQIRGADVIILATPVYFGNISGTLKVFIDRLTAIGGVHPKEGAPPGPRAKLLMVANCGFADRAQFEVIALWVRHLARAMQTELLGEVYAPQGRFLTTAPALLQPALADYRQLLHTAGRELAIGLRLTEATARQLSEQPTWTSHARETAKER